MVKKEKNIIVVGGNAAGPGAAAKAKRVDPSANVMMFESGPFISTGTCELPYVLSGEINNYKNIIFFDEQSFFEKKQVKVFIHHIVDTINRRAHKIGVRNLLNHEYQEFNYDRLILATGSIAKKIPSLNSRLKNVFTLKSVQDYLSIKNFIDNSKSQKVLIVGSGYIGLEAGEAFSRLGFEVSLIDIVSLPFPSGEAEIRNLVLETIKSSGINFYGDIKEPEFIIKGNIVKGIKFAGSLIEIDLVLLAIGFEANVSLALKSKIELGKTGAIKVDNKLKTSDSFIYAAGDCVEVTNYITGRPDYMPIATIAHELGHTAGANAAGENIAVKPFIRNIAVKIFDKTYTQVGLTLPEAVQHHLKFTSVSTVASNLVKVMPGSSKSFGKIIFHPDTKQIYGASFYGGHETIGFADIISVFIRNKIPVNKLAEVNYNYTPPRSPFINLLSILGRESIRKHE